MVIRYDISKPYNANGVTGQPGLSTYVWLTQSKVTNNIYWENNF